RIHVFPSGDTGAPRSLRRLMRLDERASLDPVVASFADVRGYLYFCCLGASLLEKGLIHAAKEPRATARGSALKDRPASALSASVGKRRKSRPGGIAGTRPALTTKSPKRSPS